MPDATAFLRAIDRAPIDAVALVVVPDAHALGEDMGDLFSQLQRFGELTKLKPFDFLKSQFGVDAGMNDHGAVVAWVAPSEDQAPRWCALIPTTDAALFLQTNMRASPKTAPDAFIWRGQTVYAKPHVDSVVISPHPELTRSYEPKSGLGERLRSRLGEPGFSVLCGGDIGLWADPLYQVKLRKADNPNEVAMEGTAPATEPDASNSQDNSKELERARSSTTRQQFQQLLGGMTDAVASVDVDGLGLRVQTHVAFDPSSELGKATRGVARAGLKLDRLPAGAFVVAGSVDIAGLGGTQSLLELTTRATGSDRVPEWLEQNKNIASAIQFAIYPSRLGVVGGGILNDAILWIATPDSAGAKTALEKWVISLAGEVDGNKREAVWEQDRVLKNGIATDAYSIKDTPLAKNGPSSRKSNPMGKIFRSLIYGPKGPNGFVKALPDGLIVTFSQRLDVIEKAVECAKSAGSLESDSTLNSMRGRMVPDPGAAAFVGIGPLFNVVRQAAKTFPIGVFEIPDSPPNLQPVAFALSSHGGGIETTTLIPTDVIGVVVNSYADRAEASQEEMDDPGAAADTSQRNPASPEPSGAPSPSVPESIKP